MVQLVPAGHSQQFAHDNVGSFSNEHKAPGDAKDPRAGLDTVGYEFNNAQNQSVAVKLNDVDDTLQVNVKDASGKTVSSAAYKMENKNLDYHWRQTAQTGAPIAFTATPVEKGPHEVSPNTELVNLKVAGADITVKTGGDTSIAATVHHVDAKTGDTIDATLRAEGQGNDDAKVGIDTDTTYAKTGGHLRWSGTGASQAEIDHQNGLPNALQRRANSLLALHGGQSEQWSNETAVKLATALDDPKATKSDILKIWGDDSFPFRATPGKQKIETAFAALESYSERSTAAPDNEQSKDPYHGDLRTRLNEKFNDGAFTSELLG